MSKNSKKHRSNLLKEDRELVRTYWLSGYDILHIAEQIECHPRLVLKSLKKQSLLIPTKTDNIVQHNNQDDYSMALNDNDVLRLDNQENVIRFFREKNPPSKNKNDRSSEVILSDSAILKKYGIFDYNSFKYEISEVSKTLDEEKILQDKRNDYEAVAFFLFPTLLYLAVLFTGFFLPTVFERIVNFLFQIKFNFNILNSFLILIFFIGTTNLIRWIYYKSLKSFLERDTNRNRMQLIGFERWSLLKINRLKLLAKKGYDLDRIATELTNTPIYNELNPLSVPQRKKIKSFKRNYNSGSVRQKLVQLGLYGSYLENNWNYQLKLVETLSKKLKKEFGSAQTNNSKDNLRDPNFIKRLITHHGSRQVEFKETFFVDLDTKKKDHNTIHASLKIICSFLNSVGGILLIGVKESGSIAGIFDDDLTTIDNYKRDVRKIIKASFPSQVIEHISVESTKIGSEDICAIKCEKSTVPVWCKHTEFNKINEVSDTHEYFYVRENGLTVSYNISDQETYVEKHF